MRSNSSSGSSRSVVAQTMCRWCLTVTPPRNLIQISPPRCCDPCVVGPALVSVRASVQYEISGIRSSPYVYGLYAVGMVHGLHMPLYSVVRCAVAPTHVLSFLFVPRHTENLGARGLSAES